MGEDSSLTRIPDAAVGGDDVLVSTISMLRGLCMLPDEGDLDQNGLSRAVRGTPDSVAIIESGGTALSKGFASLIALLGGATAVASAVTGFWSDQTTSARVTLIGGSAFFLAASAIAIAIIVAADVRGRAGGAVAQYQARQRIGTSMLELSLAAHGIAAPTPASTPTPDQPGEPVPSPGLSSPALATITALAATGAPASVTVRSTGRSGTLSGIRVADRGVEVRVTDSEGNAAWFAATDVVLHDFTWGTTTSET